MENENGTITAVHSFFNETSGARMNELIKDVINDGTYNISRKLLVSDLRNNPLYVLLYINISNILVTGLLPLALLGYLNYRISQAMRHFFQTGAFEPGPRQPQEIQKRHNGVVGHHVQEYHIKLLQIEIAKLYEPLQASKHERYKGTDKHGHKRICKY